MAARTGEHELSSNQSPLKGAVLGLLVQGPSYGYELANRLERQLGPGWSIVRPSLYRMLRGLDREGLVSSSQASASSSQDSEDTSSARIMYEATDLAESALVAWMDSPLSFDEAQLQLQARMVVARPEDLPRLLVALNQHERALFSKRDQVQAGTPAQHSLRAAMMFLVREASMQRINGELLWLDLARQTIRTLLASRT
jgi:DNA-binding PadR family transcriptional regulator